MFGVGISASSAEPTADNRDRRRIRHVRAVAYARCIACACAKIREVSATFRNRRYVLQNRRRVFLTAPLLRPEEERLIAIRIVVMGNENGAADGVAEVMLLVRRLRFRRIRTLFPGTRVEDVVAQIFERAAVEALASRLGFDFDRARTVTAILRTVVRRQDLEFGDRFDVRINVQRCVAAVIHVVAAVELPVVVFGAAAVNAVLHVAVDADRAFILVRLAHNAGCQRHELREVASVQLELGDLLARYGRA